MSRSYEELVELKQQNRITWLEFVKEGENSEDFSQWCKDHDVEESDETAEFYVEMTDINSMERQILNDDINAEEEL